MTYDTIRLATSLEEQPGHSALLVEYSLEINGQEFHPEHSLDLMALAKSCQSSGELYIFTCGCGEPGCAGIFKGIEVGHTPDAITWTYPEPLSIKDGPLDEFDNEVTTFRHFSFEPGQYIDAIDSGIKSLKSLVVSAKRPVEFPVHGVQLQNVLSLEAKIFTTHTQAPERRLVAKHIVIDAYHSDITVDSVHYRIRELCLPDELLTKYEAWSAMCVFPSREAEIPEYLAYLQSGREYCRALRKHLGQKTVVKFRYHPPTGYNSLA